MRILFVAPYLPSLIRVRPYQLIRALSDRHEITLLAAGSGDTNDLRQYCQAVEVVPVSLSRAVRSCAAGAVRGDPLQAAVCHSPMLDARLDELVDRTRFDLVHLEHLRAARLLARLPPTLARLYDAVDCISLLLERTLRSSHSFKQRAIALVELSRTRRFEGRALANADRTIVTSWDDRAALQSLAPDADVRVVPNGVDLDYFRPLAEPRAAATIVFSGKMSYHANETAALHFVQRVFPLVKAARPDVQLQIVGSEPGRAVRELAASDPAITVTGHLSDIRPRLGRAAVAVCPMVVKVGIQNKLLEAMAMAVPVVSTPIGAAGLDAEPGRDLLLGTTPAEFAAQVCHLLANPSEARTLGEAGLRYVQAHHRWNATANLVEQVYAETIARRELVMAGIR